MTTPATIAAAPAHPASRWSAAPTGIPLGGRDRFIDLIRVLAIAAVVLQHWAMPVMQFRDGQTLVSSALQTPGAQLVTWISQIMPLFFFAGGAANVVSWRSARRRTKTASSWLSVRLGRLSFPVLAVAAVWIPLPYLLEMLGAPAGPVTEATFWVARVLWFLPVYLMCVVCTPVAEKMAARRPLLALGGCWPAR
ncbi:acyltransferase family protein [Fodinicola feengrottensis]|uniref:acyltransferase family protein n=1 Tax=Fodinicola feengrottensis TaxID=435914 RepID=UPI0013D50BB6|nr:acyltransferase family protein [Fodinicola feengrottensis]